MASIKKTIDYSRFPRGINTDLSLNTIANTELGAQSRNVRITKDFFVEKESGYKSIPIVDQTRLNWDGSNEKYAVHDSFKLCFLSCLQAGILTTAHNQVNYPELFYQALKKIFQDQQWLVKGQSNFWNYKFPYSPFISFAWDRTIENIKKQKIVLSKDLIDFGLPIDTNNFSREYRLFAEVYNTLVNDTTLQIIRQFNSVKIQDHYQFIITSYVRIEPLRGLHILRLAWENFFKQINNSNVVYENMAQYTKLIAQFWVSFVIAKSQMDASIQSISPIECVFAEDKKNTITITYQQQLAIENVFDSFLTQTKDGTIYIGTYDNGLFKLVNDQLIKISNINMESGFLTQVQNETIYVGTKDNGLFKIVNEKLVQISDINVFNGFLTQVQDGTIYVGTTYNGLFKLVNEKLINISNINMALGFLTQTKDGTIYVGTRVNGLQKLANGVLVKVSSLNMFGGFLTQTQDGTIYVGTTNDGLQKLANGKLVQVSSTNVYHGFLTQTQDGTIYVGTLDSGLQKFANGKLVQVSSIRVYFGFMTQVKDGTIYVGTQNDGLFKLVNNKLVSFGLLPKSLTNFYQFVDNEPQNILTLKAPYAPTVAEVLSNQAGFGGFNMALPLAVEEINQENFNFYGHYFLQQSKYTSVGHIFAGYGDVTLKLLVGLNKNTTYWYTLAIRYQTQLFDAKINDYKTIFEKAAQIIVDANAKVKISDNDDPFITIKEDVVKKNKGRLELQVYRRQSQGDVLEDSIVIPFALVSNLPNDIYEQQEKLVKCTKLAHFGTRIVKYGWKENLFISSPLNPTYFNIFIPISNMKEGEKITDVKEFVDGTLIIFSNFRSWHLASTTNDIANPSTWEIQILSDNIGSSFAGTAIVISQRLFTITNTGIFALNKSIYAKDDFYWKRIDKFHGKEYEATIENLYQQIMQKDIIHIMTNIRNRELEIYFITYDADLKVFENFRLKWSVESQVLRWLVDTDVQKFDETRGLNDSSLKFNSGLDIMAIEAFGNIKIGMTLNGSLVEFDNNYFQFIDQPYQMAMVTKDFSFGEAFNLKKVKEVDFVLYTPHLRSQVINFEHRLGNIITTADITGKKMITNVNNWLEFIDDINFDIWENIDDKSIPINVLGSLVFEEDRWDQAIFGRINKFHRRVKILGSHKDTTSGVAFYSQSIYPLRIGGIRFFVRFKNKAAGKRTYARIV